MSKRWSIWKSFRRNFTYEDFLLHYNQFHTLLTNHYEVITEFWVYDYIPCYTTTYMGDYDDRVYQPYTNYLPEGAYEKAVYLEAHIRPVNKKINPSYTYASIEAKGLRPNKIGFYLQGNEEICKSIYKKFSASSWTFRKTSGFEFKHNSHVSLY